MALASLVCTALMYCGVVHGARDRIIGIVPVSLCLAYALHRWQRPAVRQR